MKKSIIFFVLLVAAFTASAQRTRINGYAGYVFNDKFDSYYDPGNYYSGQIDGGFQWGVGVEYVVQPRYSVELLYLNQQTKAPTTYLGGTIVTVKNTNFDLGMNWVLVGANGIYPHPNGKLEGYAGLLIGMLIANIDNPDNGNSNSATKFAWGLRLGGNIWANEKFGLKIEGKMLSAAQGAGGGFYFGTGGVGAGLSTYSTIYQFSIGGGLSIKVGK